MKYKLPFDPSVGVDVRDAPFHKTSPSMFHCIDYALPIGTPILAARSGRIGYIQNQYTENYTSPENAHKCNMVIVDHDDGECTWYVHLKSVSVKVGQVVTQGEQIGESGNTGFATYPHLHFGVYDADSNNIEACPHEPFIQVPQNLPLSVVAGNAL